jgi:murein DD-endopeptidase MepM/ murein hydrolase activator NlpD
MPRRSLLPAALVLLLLPASATADFSGAATAPTGTGGAEFGQPKTTRAVKKTPPLVASLSASAATLGTAPARFTYRVNGKPVRVQVRLDIRRADGSLVERLRLGKRRTGRDYTQVWTPDVAIIAAGSYTARLVATDTAPRARAARAANVSAALTVNPKPVVVAPGVFPVAGTWSFGAEDARFGAERRGHTHQGQDIIAAEGTPLRSPKAGTVYWKAYQGGGAGHYLVIRGTDNRDYVFMHMREASPLAKGDTVTAGQTIGAVGNTGSSSGPHLHFEIWPNGWYAENSAPIDPLPELKAWAGLA